jgi:hypothetical protein
VTSCAAPWANLLSGEGTRVLPYCRSPVPNVRCCQVSSLGYPLHRSRTTRLASSRLLVCIKACPYALGYAIEYRLASIIWWEPLSSRRCARIYALAALSHGKAMVPMPIRNYCQHTSVAKKTEDACSNGVSRDLRFWRSRRCVPCRPVQSRCAQYSRTLMRVQSHTVSFRSVALLPILLPSSSLSRASSCGVRPQ